MVELQPVDSEWPFKGITVNCSRGYDTLMIKDVQCSTIHMFLNDAILDTQCALFNSNVSNNCKTGMENFICSIVQ